MANYCVNIFAVCLIIFAFQRQIPDVIYANVKLFCGRGKCEVNQNYSGNGAKMALCSNMVLHFYALNCDNMKWSKQT